MKKTHSLMKVTQIYLLDISKRGMTDSIGVSAKGVESRQDFSYFGFLHTIFILWKNNTVIWVNYVYIVLIEVTCIHLQLNI